MQFGHYCVFQCPPWQEPGRVLTEELERAVLAEQLGFDDVWVPEQHFSPDRLARRGGRAGAVVGGPGGVDHELAVRSMRLFAEQVMPLFRG
jgi:alkanesulfonate monooxygenase SsuD/methylene tetrahydromethanopterin reductase-like flavin-dependent oxidoreductase (luciferase family)